MMQEKAIAFLERESNLEEQQALQDRKQKKRNETTIKLILMQVLPKIAIGLLILFITCVSLIGLLALFVLLISALLIMIAFEAFLFSLATVVGCLFFGLLSTFTLVQIWEWHNEETQLLIEALAEGEAVENPLGLTEEEKRSIEFEMEVVSNTFNLVRQKEDNVVSEFLADFLIQSRRNIPDLAQIQHYLISLAVMHKPAQQDHQRWIKHLAALLDYTLKAPMENRENRRTLVISYLSALFKKEGKENDYHYAQSRQDLFYTLFQEMKYSHELFAMLRDQSIPREWYLYGYGQYTEFSGQLLWMLSHQNYVKSVEGGRQPKMIFAPEESFGLVLKGLNRVNNVLNGAELDQVRAAEFRHIYEVLVTEIGVKGETASYSSIMSGAEAFYIKEERFWEGLTGFFAYLQGENEFAYEKCRETPIGYLIFMDPENEARKAASVGALVRLYRQYPDVFPGLVDQIVNGNGQHNDHRKRAIIDYLLSGLGEEHLEIQTVLQRKRQNIDLLIPEWDEDLPDILPDENLLQQIQLNALPVPVLDMARNQLKSQLIALSHANPKGSNTAFYFDGIIHGLCALEEGGMDVEKIALLLTKMINEGAMLFFTNPLDAEGQALLDRLVEVIFHWANDWAADEEHGLGLVGEEIESSTRRLLIEIYAAVESKTGHRNIYYMQGLNLAYGKLGLTLNTFRDELDEMRPLYTLRSVL